MNEKTLKFHKSEQAIDLDSVTTDRIKVSDKFNHCEGYIFYWL